MKVLRAPRVTLELFGDESTREVHRKFTARHPRFRVTAAKRWGVALLRLPGTFDDYLAGVSTLARRRRRHALSEGCAYRVVPPLEHLDEIVEINRSAPERQGRPMPDIYVDRRIVEDTFRSNEPIHGVFDGQGRLRAYAVVPDIGDTYVVSYLLGHADDLDAGIVYLLMTEIVQACIGGRRADGSPAWLMYDTFWGASRGLVFFKERVGFAPYTVNWVWVDREADRTEVGSSNAD